MEQYTKELGIDMGSPQGAKSVVAVMDVSNGQTKIISTISLNESGNNFVQNVIESMTEKSSVEKKRGTRGTKAENLGMIFRDLNQRGIVVLKPRKKSVVDIVEKSFTLQKLHPISARSRVQCIKDLIYLMENKLITLPTTGG